MDLLLIMHLSVWKRYIPFALAKYILIYSVISKWSFWKKAEVYFFHKHRVYKVRKKEI